MKPQHPLHVWMLYIVFVYLPAAAFFNGALYLWNSNRHAPWYLQHNVSIVLILLAIGWAGIPYRIRTRAHDNERLHRNINTYDRTN